MIDNNKSKKNEEKKARLVETMKANLVKRKKKIQNIEKNSVSEREFSKNLDENPDKSSMQLLPTK